MNNQVEPATSNGTGTEKGIVPVDAPASTTSYLKEMYFLTGPRILVELTEEDVMEICAALESYLDKDTIHAQVLCGMLQDQLTRMGAKHVA